MAIDHLKFSPNILRRLGEELIPHPDQGIVELVRNAYDADALTCQVELLDTRKAGGTVRIRDDGDGMDIESIRNGWLLVGRSSKTPSKISSLGRRPVGNKGLGRLAALRMGKGVSLVTRPSTEPDIEYHLPIDWAEFDRVAAVEDVDLQIEDLPRPAGQGKGTIITIQDVSATFDQKDVERLARSLLLLADPFQHKTSFRPELVVPEFKKLETLVKNKYFDDAELHLIAELDSRGKASATVRDWKGKLKWKASHEELRKSETPYKCPAAKFELWVFLLKSQPDFSARSATLSELRKWLSVCGGVHLYHRGLRVHPYGDPGHDWLSMNLRRVQSPEERPSTNNSIGRVLIDDPEELLVQKTDRTGFVETDQFQEVRRFATDALEWLATKRLEERDKGRQLERRVASKKATKAKESLTKVLDAIPSKSRSAVKSAVARYEQAITREVRALQSEVQLYRTLSTVGTTFAVFAHEIEAPSKRIRKLAESIERRAQEQLGFEKYEGTLQSSVGSILRSADEIGLFPKLALRLLERDKRRIGPVRVHAAIQEVVALFGPFLERYEVEVKTEFSSDEPVVLGSVAAIESVMTNLLTNTFNAFDADGTQRRKREVVIRTGISNDETLVLRVLDSGHGIKGLDVNEIWLPGRTTLPDGTGLGLTIVRDAVTDLGGKTHAIARSELGGAEIVVEIPLERAQ